MKWFSVPALLAAALLSVVVALPFVPGAKNQPDLFILEARVASTTAGAFQVYYEDSAGLREELSGRVTLAAGATAATYRLPIPPGSYRSLRLDPLDRAGTVTVSSLRVLSPAGGEVASLPLAGLVPVQQIASTQLRDGALAITTTPAADDPQLALAFSPPLVVAASWRDYARGSAPLVLGLFAGLAVVLLAFDRLPGMREALAGRMRRLAVRPGRCIAVVAALAVVASAYPVVFLGKSYVSPNLGTVLLYDTYPTLPGYRSAETTDVKLSDVGAVMWQHVPFSMLQHRALRHGELPLWNRYNAAGVPLLAQGQSMFGDPLHFLVIAANGAAWAWDLKYLLAKWLFATGLALTVLALAGGVRRAADDDPARGTLGAALLVAIAAPFAGFFLYRINHPAFFSLCYAPWPLFCLVRIAQAATWRELAGLGTALIVANLALMNSGTVKEAYMLLVCVNFAGGLVILAATAGRDRGRKIAAVAWAGVIFVLLTAPIWSTFLQTLRSAYTGYNAVSAYQIQPTLLLGAFDEIFYRPLMEQDRVFSPSLNFLLLLGVLYFLATLRLQFGRPAVMAVAASSLLPLSLAFGLVPPAWIVRLPFLANIAHLDNTFSCVLIVLWSVLAGVGFATAAQRLGTRDGRHDLIIAGLLLGALVFGWIAFGQAAHRPIYGPIFTVNKPGEVLRVSPFIWGYLTALLVASVLLGALAQRAFARRSGSIARSLLLAGCAATLLWRHGLHGSSVGHEAFTARPTDRANFHARSGAMEFARAAHAREPGRGFGFNGNFFPGWTGVYGLETVHGPDALVNPWLRELVGVSGVERLWDWRLYVEAPNVAKAQPFFDALNVRFYFDALSQDPALARHLQLRHRADLDVYESPTAWPRAFFTSALVTYDQPAELIARFASAAGRPFAALQQADVASVPGAATLPRDPAGANVNAATGYTLTENTTSFRVRADGPGIVVLTEAFWPRDFVAEANGRRLPVVRVNHAFKGVVVDTAGDYLITFRYWPRNFTRNLVLSALGAALLGLSLFLARRITPRDPATGGERRRADAGAVAA